MSSRSERAITACGKPTCWICAHTSPPGHPNPRLPPPSEVALAFADTASRLLAYLQASYPGDPELARLDKVVGALRRLPPPARAERWSALVTTFRNRFWRDEYGMVLRRERALFSLPTIMLLVNLHAEERWAAAPGEVREAVWGFLADLVRLARMHTPPSSRLEAEFPQLWDKAVAFARSETPRDWQATTQSAEWEAQALKKAQEVYPIYVRKARRPDGHIHFPLA